MSSGQPTTETVPRLRHKTLKILKQLLWRIPKPLKSLADWLNAHSALLQTLIAALMLVTLLQNARTLRLTQRQFESTIEPVLEFQMAADGILYVINQGSIPIRNLELAGWIEISFRDNRKNYIVNHSRHTFTNQIDAAKFAKIDLSKLPFITLPKGPNPNQNLYCLVLKYRRTADMKPFLRPVPFLTCSAPGYMPMFASIGTSFGGLATQTPIDAYREELMQMYKQRFVDQAVHEY